MQLLATVILIFLLMLIMEKLTDTYLGVKRKSVSDTSGKTISRLGKMIIILIFFASYYFAFTNEVDSIFKWNWILFVTAIMGLQAILEWKYIKSSKQYFSTLISSMISIGILLFFVIS